MKKALSYVVAACILLMSLSGMCFAATTYQPTISAESGVVGDTVAVTVSIPASTDIAGGSLNLVYDDTKLKLVDAKAGEILSSNNPIVNTGYEDKVRLSFGGLNAISESGGVALTATFELTAAGTATFSTEEFKLANTDDEYLTCDNATKSITIVAAEEKIYKPTVAVKGESDVNVKVYLPADADIAGGSFNLVYDNTKLELVDAVAGTALSANNPAVNTAYENKIRLSFGGINAISENGAVALEANFTAIADGNVVFAVEEFKLADADDTYLTCLDAQTTATVKVNTDPIPVTGVTLDQTTLSLSEGKTATLTATVLPEAATDKSVTWKSSDEKVATVANGVVTAKSVGTATITVTTADGGKTATCDVTVTENFEPTICVSDARGRAGETVEVTVSIKNNPGLTGLQLSCEYDENLELVGIKKGTALGMLTFTKPGDLTANPIVLPWDGEGDDDTSNGDALVLSFKINENTQLGAYEIECVPTRSYNADLLPVEVSSIKGKITVVNYIPGDVNDDGLVDVLDVTVLRRYIAGGYNVKVVEDAVDINRDGTTDVLDVTVLRRFIAGGYGIELK